MIKYVKGNIFDSKCTILVNPINRVGVMGAGLAKQFKQRYPEMFEQYKLWCNGLGVNHVVDEILFLYEDHYYDEYIIGFPTKNHWKEQSDLDLIEEGLKAMQLILTDKSNSIAFSKLGCGLGGLDWETQVKPLMEKYLSRLDCEIEIYE